MTKSLLHFCLYLHLNVQNWKKNVFQQLDPLKTNYDEKNLYLHLSE